MDAADLRVFAAIARTGSMSKAAAELGTVQSNVTARIKALEDRLGMELFERTNRCADVAALIAQSPLRPAALISGPHLSRSCFSKDASAPGEPPAGSKPICSRRWRVSG